MLTTPAEDWQFLVTAVVTSVVTMALQMAHVWKGSMDRFAKVYGGTTLLEFTEVTFLKSFSARVGTYTLKTTTKAAGD